MGVVAEVTSPKETASLLPALVQTQPNRKSQSTLAPSESLRYFKTKQSQNARLIVGYNENS